MMNMKSTLAAVSAGLLLAVGSAQAQVASPYVTLGIGANWLDDMDLSGGGLSNKADGDLGVALMGAAGINLYNVVRTELEYSFRRNSFDDISGAARSNSVMLNVLYDVPFSFASFTPYIGAGLGAAWVTVDSNNTAFGTIDDKDRVWAYQGIVGVASALDYNWKVTLDYRYLSSFDSPEFNTSSGTTAKGDWSNHTVMVGLRYTFGAPPAPAATPVAAPAPAPAPAPAAAPLVRSFLVFFDFDRSDITADARKIIQQAADNSKKAGGTSRITLTGHADRSGAAQYNMRLSQRRADAVKAELVRLGVSAADIATVAKGESDPLVPTADGVREPRNRRVEIVF